MGFEHLMSFVADRDEPCPMCEYSLRGLTEPCCPECGAALELRVGSPQLRVGPWAVAMVSFALGLGFDGVVSALMIVALAVNPTAKWEPIGIASGFVVLTGVMVLGLIRIARSRSAWTRCPVHTQRIQAAAVFVSVGVLHAVVGAAFFLVVS